MVTELAALPGWVSALVVVIVVLGGVLVRRPALKLLQHVVRSHATARIVREQRKMVGMALRPGTELRHSLDDGPELVIRCAASPQPPTDEQDAQ